VGHRTAAADAPGGRKGEPTVPGSGSTDAPEIPAAAALRAAQTMTATPPAIAAARTVRTRIQAGGTSLLSTAQPAKSRAAALPLVTVQSSSEDRPAFPIDVDPSLPRFLRPAQSLFRAGPCDGTRIGGPQWVYAAGKTSCRSPLTRERRCARSNLPIARSRNQESVRRAQLIRGRCPLGPALPRGTPRDDDR
jgi:hypothetical protein